MCRLNELINEFCPYGVEYKRLGGKTGICEVLPSGVDKVIKENERLVRLCNYMDVYNNQYITDELVVSFMDGSVTKPEYERYVLRAGQVLLTKDSETKEDIAKTAYVCKDFNDVVCAYHLAVLTPIGNINGKYLNYVLQSEQLRNYFARKANGVSRFGLKLKSIEEALIPVPPLTVQEEIARILDKFTSLEEELQAELQVRKKQYEYYRDELFTFGDNLEWTTLGKIGTNLDNKRKPIAKSKREHGQYPYYGASGIVDYVKGYIFDGDYLLVSEDGANLIARKTPIAFSVSGKVWVNNHAHIIEFENKTTQRYVELYLNSIDLSKYINTAAQPKITKASLNSIEIPLATPEKQKYIVAILDRFDALVNDITQGLPAEIEARRKQYEYYRDKLLTFKLYEEGDSYNA